MTETNLSVEQKNYLEQIARDEATSELIYNGLAELEKNEENAKILRRIGRDEQKHYKLAVDVLGYDVEPQMGVVRRTILAGRVFGLNFALKRMENAEAHTQHALADAPVIEHNGRRFDFEAISVEEEAHERELIRMIHEEKLNYMSSIVLGLNDALVELTGALAGYTFAFQNNRLTAMTGLITGISAALSMAASEYLSKRQDGDLKVARRSALYTGLTYLVTVLFLILPYLLIPNSGAALLVTLAVAVGIIALFNYYNAVARDENFRRNFLEMAVISLGVAFISFLIGSLVNRFFAA